MDSYMESTNINDSAGIQALLEQLRSSPAWQALNVEPISNDPNIVKNSSVEIKSLTSSNLVHEESVTGASGQISSLLSRLAPSNVQSSAPSALEDQNTSVPPQVSHDTHGTKNANQILQTQGKESASVKTLTYSQSLSIIGQLASGEQFLKKIKKLQNEQVELEKKLWQEREHIIKSYEGRVRVAQTKATIIGTYISEYELKKMEDDFVKELKKFDIERALAAWDSLVISQQRTLESLDVPGMFISSSKTDREKQQRIAQVLEGLIGEDDKETEPL